MVLDDVARPQNWSTRGFQEGRGLPIASVRDRFLAFVFDAALIGPLIVFLLSPIFRQAYSLGLFDSLLREALIIFAVGIGVGVFLFATMQALLWGFFGATFGQMILKIRVVSVQRKNPDLSAATLRAFLWWCQVLLMGLPFLEVLSHRHRRPLHDRASETWVISLKEKSFDPVLPLEGKFVSLVLLSASLTAFLWLGFATHQVYLGVSRVSHLEDELASADYFCDEVSKFSADLAGSSSRRMEAALTLYFVGQIDDDCLRKEADFQNWRRTPTAESLLAKGLVVLEYLDLSAEYFHRVCEDWKGSPACWLGELLLSESELNGEKARQVLGDSRIRSRLYLQAWSLRLASRVANFEHIEDILRQLERYPRLGSFVNYHRLQSMWFQGKSEQSEGLVTASLPLAYRDKDARTISFKCRESLLKDCSARSPFWCQRLSRIEEQVADLRDIEGVRWTLGLVRRCARGNVSSYAKEILQRESAASQRKSWAARYLLIRANSAQEVALPLKWWLEESQKDLAWFYTGVELVSNLEDEPKEDLLGIHLIIPEELRKSLTERSPASVGPARVSTGEQ